MVGVQDREDQLDNLVEEMGQKILVVLFHGDNRFVCGCQLTVRELEEVEVDVLLGECLMEVFVVFFLDPAVGRVAWQTIRHGRRLEGAES